jgi:hypothetical protein
MDALTAAKMILRRAGRALALLACLYLSVGPASAASAERSKWRKRWRVSMIAVAVASAVDFSSSAGRYESNPLMRNASGRFSAGKGLTVKGGVLAGLLVTQGLAMRGRRDSLVEKTATVSNLSAAAALTAVSVRNWTVPK